MGALLQDVALSGGLQQGIGEPHIPAGEFLSIVNGRQIRAGAIEKRPGMSKLGTFSAATAVSALFAVPPASRPTPTTRRRATAQRQRRSETRWMSARA